METLNPFFSPKMLFVVLISGCAVDSGLNIMDATSRFLNSYKIILSQAYSFTSSAWTCVYSSIGNYHNWSNVQQYMQIQEWDSLIVRQFRANLFLWVPHAYINDFANQSILSPEQLQVSWTPRADGPGNFRSKRAEHIFCRPSLLSPPSSECKPHFKKTFGLASLPILPAQKICR